jgi:hypothetical protein
MNKLRILSEVFIGLFNFTIIIYFFMMIFVHHFNKENDESQTLLYFSLLCITIGTTLNSIWLFFHDWNSINKKVL